MTAEERVVATLQRYPAGIGKSALRRLLMQRTPFSREAYPSGVVTSILDQMVVQGTISQREESDGSAGRPRTILTLADLSKATVPKVWDVLVGELKQIEPICAYEHFAAFAEAMGRKQGRTYHTREFEGLFELYRSA